MNYSEMSDFEINEAVSKTLLSEAANPNARFVAIGDYCRSWADAGPIIQKYGIAIAFDEFEQEWVAFSEFRFDKAGWDMEVEPKKYHHNKDPLRAAMIVFLMMQEAK